MYFFKDRCKVKKDEKQFMPAFGSICSKKYNMINIWSF